MTTVVELDPVRATSGLATGANADMVLLVGGSLEKSYEIREYCLVLGALSGISG
jgi:hypothetical protein